MVNGSSVSAVPIERRSGSWKRRIKIGDLLVLIGILAIDLACLRAAAKGQLFPLFPLLGLLAIMVVFVWRHVPRRWARAGYVGALILYLLVLGTYVAAMNPFLAGPLRKALGIQ